ncbi:hypothetical protein [Terasakiella pusilla]|uniref:hypothetical protein n=1 Tax=Terasakiella pusilla TaxID=64973 RepID=UPI003AA980A3
MNETIDIMGREEWEEALSKPNPWARFWFTDDEASDASGMSPRNLRALQALGFIQSVKAKRVKGAQIRMWSSVDVLAAALVFELTQQTGLSTGTMVSLLNLLKGPVLVQLLEEADSNANLAATGAVEWLTNESDVIAMKGDVHIVIVDRQYVFVEGRWQELDGEWVPDGKSDLLPIGKVDKIYSQTPTIQALPANEKSEIRNKMIEKREHPISLHSLNLDLALRSRIYQAISGKDHASEEG